MIGPATPSRLQDTFMEAKFCHQQEGKKRCGTSDDSKSSSRGGDANQDTGKEGKPETEAEVDERKKRRMQSNRESARRSRMRKQQHLDELRANVAQLRAQNSEMLTRFSVTSKRFAKVCAENKELRTEAMGLEVQLHRLLQMAQDFPPSP